MSDKLQSHNADEHIVLGQVCNGSAAHTRSCEAMTQAGMDTCARPPTGALMACHPHTMLGQCGHRRFVCAFSDLFRERAEGPADTPFSLVKTALLVLKCHFRLKARRGQGQ
jgi:hypothetical protein